MLFKTLIVLQSLRRLVFEKKEDGCPLLALSSEWQRKAPCGASLQSFLILLQQTLLKPWIRAL